MSVSVFAQTNRQKVYSVTDSVYSNIEKLYIMQGRALPSSSGPWSEDELVRMLNKIDYSSLSTAGKNIYDKVNKELNSEKDLVLSDGVALDFDADFSLEGYFHTNSNSFTKETDWAHGYGIRKPLVNANVETWAIDRFYGYFEIEAGNTGDDVIYKAPVSFNTEFILPTSGLGVFGTFSWTMPYKALVSAGGEHWNLIAGRDRLSWGSGETGNLMLSKSFRTHTMAKFATYFDSFKYSLVGTMYPIYAYYDKENKLIYEFNPGYYSTIYGWKSLIVHRIEARLLNDKLGLALNEACLFFGYDKSGFNLAMINPFGFMHNEYKTDNANSLLVLEADYAVTKGLNAYAQLAVDDFVGPGEENQCPPGYGVLAGLKYVEAVNKGVFKLNAEASYVSPFCYLRGIRYEHGDFNQKVAGFHTALLHGPDYGMEDWLTYSEGNDCLVADIRASFEKNDYSFGAELKYKANGVIGINSLWGMYNIKNYNPTIEGEVVPIEKAPKFLATNNPFENTTIGSIQHTFTTSLSARWNTPVKNLSVSGCTDLIYAINKNNVKDNNCFDLQLTLGVNYSL